MQTLFSAINANFSGPSLDRLDTRRPAHTDVKEGYPSKVVSAVSSSSVKTVADRHKLAAYRLQKTADEP